MARLSYLAVGMGLFGLLAGGCPVVQPSAELPSGMSASQSGADSPTDGSGGSDNQTGITAPNTAGAADTAPCNEPASADQWKEQVLELVNQERTSRGLGALAVNVRLESEAERYACELIQYDYFAHVNPDTGETLAQRAVQAGYSYQVIGENLAAGQTTPGEVMQDWMASEGHRENILDPRFVEIGIAVRTGGDYGTYWVQEFGLPR
jgi:uncharacterized protein YkwD